MNFKFLAVVLGLLALISMSEASHVEDLTTDTFQDFLSSNEFVLVEFFAPWCGHCKTLAPEYEKAANQLYTQGSDIKLAKVDATKQEALGKQYQVQGYPTLIWFRNGKPQEYNGPREAAGIVAWVTRKTGPVTVAVTTKAELDAQIAKGSAVVGFFEKDSAEHKAFVEVAQVSLVETIPFVDVLSAEVTQEAGEKVNTVKVYRNFGETLTFDGEITDKTLFNFVASHGFPYVEHASVSWGRILGRGVEKMLVLIADVEDVDTWNPLHAAATNLAVEFLNDVGVVYLAKDFFERAEQFGLSGKSFPAALVLMPKKEKSIPFPEDSPLNEENLRTFIQDVNSGKIVPQVKSAPVPESNDGPVLVLVGSTFDELVINNDKDVLVEFYAPWCAHCKHLEPTFVSLGEHYAEYENIVIAKMDSTTNDNEHVAIEGYPTIVFFPAGKKDTPVTYDKPRNLKSFVEFLDTNAKPENLKVAESKDEL